MTLAADSSSWTPIRQPTTANTRRCEPSSSNVFHRTTSPTNMVTHMGACGSWFIGSEPMNQLPHAPICVTIFVGDVVLWKTFDEDGSQRLVLAVVGCRIGVQEELSAASVIHDRTPQVLGAVAK